MLFPNRATAHGRSSSDEVRQAELRAALGRDLVEAAVLQGSFRLRSGAQSSYYIDKYLFTTRPDLLRRIADELAALLPPGVERLAGPVLGAIPLVTAVSLATELPMLIVRVEQAKEYGTAKQIEGTLVAGEKVVLIEDIVTTAGAALGAVETLRQSGAEVLGALVVVDREQGGAEAFAAADVPYQALFTRSELGL
jgi:orotate phosphoribosyltransferase